MSSKAERFYNEMNEERKKIESEAPEILVRCEWLTRIKKTISTLNMMVEDGDRHNPISRKYISDLMDEMDQLF